MNQQIFRNGILLVAEVRLASGFAQRLRGLLFTRDLAHDAGLLIRPCRQVHTLGMQFSIDVVFLDHNDIITRCLSELAPVRVAHDSSACQVLELAAGSIARLALAAGQQLCIGRPAAVHCPALSVAPGEQSSFGPANQDTDGQTEH